MADVVLSFQALIFLRALFFIAIFCVIEARSRGAEVTSPGNLAPQAGAYDHGQNGMICRCWN